MGQICREGMDESGILLKAPYRISYLPHFFDRISLAGVAGCLGGAISPPVGPGQIPGGGQGGEAPGSSSDPAVHSTKKRPQKTTFLVHFYLCAAYKLKGKIHLN